MNLEIYIEINGQCIPNGTYIEDSDLHIAKNISNLIKCVLSGKRLNGGQWLRPDGRPVNYSDFTLSDPLQCVVMVITSYAFSDNNIVPLKFDYSNFKKLISLLIMELASTC